jgi:hypothetical protein
MRERKTTVKRIYMKYDEIHFHSRRRRRECPRGVRMEE